MKHFEGRTAFVTGGASGIGLGMTTCLLNEGMNVVIADINAEHIAAAKSQLDGRAVHTIALDVSDRDAVREAAAECGRIFGNIHVLCNNAGIGDDGAPTADDFAAWDRTLEVTLGGVVNCTKIISPLILAHGEGGHIINTSSMAGMVPAPNLAAYTTAKYAVRGFSESLRMSLAPHGIGVSCLFPGATRTALVDIPATDDDLSSDASGDYMRAFFAAMRAAMDPIEIGERVVQAIRANQFHIFTHGEFLAEVVERNSDIERAFPPGEGIPEARTHFESLRRAIAKDLLSTPAKD